MIKLSILDQSPVAEGKTQADALGHTIALAKAADSWGYHRYWLAEHHNTTSFAGSAPEIMIGRIAQETKSIRVGSGGVMLMHYSPLKVAEQFLVLHALYPGRIDLGLGRAPGADPRAIQALTTSTQTYDIETFPRQLALLDSWLADDIDAGHPYPHVHAMPRGPGEPELWLLGSGVQSAVYAAELGAGFCFAHFISADGGPQVLARYRQRFHPSRHNAAPKGAFAISVMVADTEEEARRQVQSRNLWVVQLLQDKAGPFPSPETAEAYPWTPQELAALPEIAKRGVVGTPEQVRRRLLELAEAYDAEEIFALTITHDETARHKSYRLLADAFGLSPRG